MSAISDYGSLMIDAGEYAGRNDFAHVYSRLVALAESKLNRLLRVAEMEKAGTVTLTDGRADLPADFLEMRSLVGPSGGPLFAISLTDMENRYRGRGGYPTGYSIVGNVLQTGPSGGATLNLKYYAKIPALTPSSPTNWLLEKAPDVYLYGLVEEIAIWGMEADKATAARSLKMEAVKGLKSNDQAARWGNGRVRLGTFTP